MRIMKRVILILCLIIGSNTYGQNSVTLDHTNLGIRDGYALPDEPIDLFIRFTVDDFNITGVTTYFRVYLSNNGELALGTFQPVTMMEEGNFCDDSYFDLLCGSNEYSNGMGADTIGVSAGGFTSDGLPAYYDTVCWSISTMVSAANAGDSLCIDSSANTFNEPWLWAAGANGNFVPTWDGPICFEILPNCCVGTRGNVDGGFNEPVDIGDVVYLVAYYFLGFDAPSCPYEADVNADGLQDVSDLVFLVDYMFNLGPAPAVCPS